MFYMELYFCIAGIPSKFVLKRLYYRLYVCLSQSLLNVRIILILIYSNCVIVNSYTPVALLL